MAGSLGSLIVGIGADVAQLRADMGKATKLVGSATQRMQAMATTARRALGLIAGALTVRGIASFVQSTFEAADSVGKLSQQIGVGAESLQKWQYAAKLADVDQANLRTGMARLSKAMLEATGNTGKAGGIFRALGISLRDSSGNMRDAGDVMLDLSDKFRSMEDGAAKTALTMELFGRGNAGMAVLLNAGSAAIRKQGDALERMGGVMSEDVIKQSELFNDSLATLKTAAESFARAVTLRLAPSLSAAASAMAEAAAEGAGFFGVLKAGYAQITKVGDIDRLTKKAEALASVEQKMLANRPAQGFGAGQVESLTKLRAELAATQKEIAKLSVSEIDASAIPAKLQSASELKALEDALAGSTKKAKELNAVLGDDGADKRLRDAIELAESAADEFDKIVAQQDAAAERIFESTRTPFERYIADMDEVRVLHESGRISAETMARAERAIGDELTDATARAIPQLEELDDAMRSSESVAQELGMTFSSAFEDAIVSGRSLSEILKGLEQDIMRIVTRKLITEPLADSLGGMFSGGGNGIFSKLFGGPRANGGPVESGRAYLVGERGPELFMPRQSGRIQASGAGGITINVHGVTDADSFRRSRTQVAAAAQFALARAGARNG